jgi:hypothetical protein
MRSILRILLLLAIPVVVGAGAYDLMRVSTDYSASGHPFVRMVSGPAGGTWYPLGAKMSQVFKDAAPEILAASGPGGGIENVRDVDQRNAEIGFSMSDAVFNGYRGQGKFHHEQTHVRHLATTYLNILQVAVPMNSSVRGIADLKDKNISPGKAGWGGTEMARLVLEAHGITFDSIRQNGGTVHHVDFSDSVALMKDGHIDAFFALSSVPQSSIMELDFDPGVRLLSVEGEALRKALAARPGYVPVTIPGTVYENLEGDVHTLGVPVVLIAHEDLSEDLAYRLTKALWDKHAAFVEVTPVWKTVSLENALLGASAPVHPGAQRYYDEQGVTPAQ